MQGVNVKSEIGNLKKVILHRPGDELLNLTPNTLEELLAVQPRTGTFLD